MGPRALYLHETVDIIGQGQYDYMEHVAREPTNVMPDMMSLQGSFFVCAAGGGRWPQVINIWDIGERGWQGWASNVDRLNLKRRRAFYGDWWDQASQWRSGGFDRLCGAVPGSPTTAELAASGVRGTLFVHELLAVHPGRRLEFLREVERVKVPLWSEYGHQPTGLYEVLSNDREVVLVWATDIAAQVRLRSNRDASHGLGDEGESDDRLLAWEARSAEHVTCGDMHVMTPLPGTVYGPDDWEDARLDDWMHVPAEG